LIIFLLKSRGITTIFIKRFYKIYHFMNWNFQRKTNYV